jgi:hypothetical protein
MPKMLGMTQRVRAPYVRFAVMRADETCIRAKDKTDLPRTQTRISSLF